MIANGFANFGLIIAAVAVATIVIVLIHDTFWPDQKPWNFKVW